MRPLCTYLAFVILGLSVRCSAFCGSCLARLRAPVGSGIYGSHRYVQAGAPLHRDWHAQRRLVIVEPAGSISSDENSVNDKVLLPNEVEEPGAAKFNEAIKKFLSAAEWKKAVLLIQKMREQGLKPSMEVYLESIVWLRRCLEFDRADTLLEDMYSAWMPDDLFSAYAAPGPVNTEDGPVYPQIQKVFALMLVMRQDKLSPDVDTYRALMGLCTKEKMWYMSLLLLRYMTNNNVTPGKFIYNEICTALDNEGKPELAEMIYEHSLQYDVFELWMEEDNAMKIDLHNFTVNTARAAVRSSFSDMIRKPANRYFHDPGHGLEVVVGMGHRSDEGVPLIKPAIHEMLNEEMHITAEIQARNAGCLEISSATLQEYVRKMKSFAAKPHPHRTETAPPKAVKVNGASKASPRTIPKESSAEHSSELSSESPSSTVPGELPAEHSPEHSSGLQDPIVVGDKPKRGRAKKVLSAEPAIQVVEVGESPVIEHLDTSIEKSVKKSSVKAKVSVAKPRAKKASTKIDIDIDTQTSDLSISDEGIIKKVRKPRVKKPVE